MYPPMKINKLEELLKAKFPHLHPVKQFSISVFLCSDDKKDSFIFLRIVGNKILFYPYSHNEIL